MAPDVEDTAPRSRLAEPNLPFRWDLAGRSQLGTLLAGTAAPDLWFLPDLVDCAAKVLARSGDGRLFFVGRSADSVADLLSGALSESSRPDRLSRLPFSLRSDLGELSSGEVRQVRANLAAVGISPRSLAAAGPPTVFVDLVYAGYTFANLFNLLRAWAREEGAPWEVIRRKIRFCGITRRTKTSPNTWRWYQQAEWVRQLPASATVSVSIDRVVWAYFGNTQAKLTASFNQSRWASEAVRIPVHDEATRAALAEAVAIVEAGRSRAVRGALVRELAAEPAFAQPWLRALAAEVRQ